MNRQKLCSLVTASIASVVVSSGIDPAKAAIINFNFYSTSNSGVSGRIAFDDLITTPGQVSSKPTVATYLGAIQSYNITNGTHSFSGSGTFSSNQIKLHNNIIDINDSFNRTWAGDGLEFQISDRGIFLRLRFVYPNTTVLNSLSLSDISLQNSIASQVPQLSPPATGSLFTLLQVSDFIGFVIQDGTFFGSDFVTSTSNTTPIPEPATILGLVTTMGLGAWSIKEQFKKQKKS